LPYLYKVSENADLTAGKFREFKKRSDQGQVVAVSICTDAQ